MHRARQMPGAGEHRPALLAEINITPMVDVMLVLLIVFMVTAPLAASGVDVDLPQGQAKAINPDSEPVEVTIDSAGKIFLSGNEIEAERFSTTIAALAALTPDVANARVFVRADRSLDYGYVLGVVNAVSAAGFTKVAFLSEPAQSGSPAR